MAASGFGASTTRARRKVFSLSSHRVSPETNWVDVGLGDSMAFAIKSDGTLWAWGRHAHLFTGVAHEHDDSSPARVGTDSDWRACGPFFQSRPIFLKRDGSVWIMNPEQRGVAPVTAIVSGLVTNNQLRIVADNTTLGGDPAYGIVKRLRITFQLGGAKQTLNFRETSPVSIGTAGQPLTITLALYGDPRLFRGAAEAAARTSWESAAGLRRIELSKDVAALAGGRDGLGVALTRDGEVWTWGPALGEYTRGNLPVRCIACLLRTLNPTVRGGEPTRLSHTEPCAWETWMCRNGRIQNWGISLLVRISAVTPRCSFHFSLFRVPTDLSRFERYVLAASDSNTPLRKGNASHVDILTPHHSVLRMLETLQIDRSKLQSIGERVEHTTSFDDGTFQILPSKIDGTCVLLMHNRMSRREN